MNPYLLRFDIGEAGRIELAIDPYQLSCRRDT